MKWNGPEVVVADHLNSELFHSPFSIPLQFGHLSSFLLSVCLSLWTTWWWFQAISSFCQLFPVRCFSCWSAWSALLPFLLNSCSVYLLTSSGNVTRIWTWSVILFPKNTLLPNSHFLPSVLLFGYPFLANSFIVSTVLLFISRSPSLRTILAQRTEASVIVDRVNIYASRRGE